MAKRYGNSIEGSARKQYDSLDDMMVQVAAYEYLTVVNVRQAGGSLFGTWLLFWPGETEPETRPEPELLPSILFNELGADGWKLVASEVMDSVIEQRWGWSEVATPARTMWLFMREGKR